MEPLLTELYSLKSPQGPPAQAKREAVPRLPWERRGDNVRAESPYQVSRSFAAPPHPSPAMEVAHLLCPLNSDPETRP